MAVQQHETPAERADTPVEVTVDEAFTVHAAQLDEWVAPMEHWELDTIQEFDRELWLTLDERDGIARAVHLAPLGMDVELFHIVGAPLGGTPACD